jgi:hypothetical protein
MEHSRVKSKFKTPEGRFVLSSERSYGCLPFNPMRVTKLTLATFEGLDEAGQWLIYNVGEFVYISRPDSTKNVRLGHDLVQDLT